jgi:hypothetical protein
VSGLPSLKALEADSRMWVEHERVEAERDKLAGEMENMAGSIAQIAHTVGILRRRKSRRDARTTWWSGGDSNRWPSRAQWDLEASLRRSMCAGCSRPAFSISIDALASVALFCLRPPLEWALFDKKNSASRRIAPH